MKALRIAGFATLWTTMGALTIASVVQVLTDPYPGPRLVVSVAFFAVLLAFPASITIAILRHRLFDIDLLIKSALVYGSLTAATAGTYLLLVLGFGWLARNVAGQGSNEVAVAATTLIVAAIFQPARRRIQSVVDRRFYRARYDARQTLEAFQQRLREETDLTSLRDNLAGTVNEATRPAQIFVWLPGALAIRNDCGSRDQYRNAQREQV